MKNPRGLLLPLLGLIIPTALLFSAAGCSPSVPFLYIDVQNDYYLPDEVSITYFFQSESDFQPCRITISRHTLPENVVVVEENDVFPSEGRIGWWELSPGSYTLRFSVLSQRGTSANILPFLDKSYDFVVH